MDRDEKLLQTMRNNFSIEMSERLLALSQYSAALEDAPDRDGDNALLILVLRELHNLKGAARAVNLPEIEELCHALESVVSVYQQTAPNESQISTLVDVLYNGIAWGDKLLNLLNVGHSLQSQELDTFINHINPDASADPTVAKDILGQNPVEISPPPTWSMPKPASVTLPQADAPVRISGTKLDDLLAASTELLVARLRMRQHHAAITTLVAETQTWSHLWRDARSSFVRLGQQSTNDGPQRGKDLITLLRFVGTNQHRLKNLETQLAHLQAGFSRDIAYLSMVTDQLQFETRRLRLIPLSLVMEEMERSVRLLARELGKQVQLVVHGAELEVDKKLLDEIRAPLLHLLRNALDHGLESPAQRLHLHKPAMGTLTVSFRQANGSIVIEVRDDGSGIDVERVRAVALERAVVPPALAEDADTQTIMDWIFHSGFSTRAVVSDVSGRGIGLDSVREAAMRLGGSIAVESWLGQGTVFRLSVPNMLVTAEGILVTCGAQTLVVPVDSVERTFQLRETDIQTIGTNPHVSYEGSLVVLMPLAHILGLPPAQIQASTAPYVIILQSQGRKAAFRVDALLRNQEVVVKSLSTPLVRVRHIAGATILADGQVALILNPDDLLRTAMFQGGKSGAALPFQNRETTQPSPVATQGLRRILIVDDSNTTRTLEKNILEAAGYAVQTARNGVEALTHLRSQPFDLVLTDLEMPEMDGFTLITNIKQEQRLAEMPVVVVTSLDSAENKIKGMEAGADAYVVKSRFEQSSLLTTIRQMLYI